MYVSTEMAKRPTRKGRPALPRAEPLPREQVAFGNRLARHRAAAGMTQTELAEKAGIRQTHVSKLELGQVEPRLATITKLARALGIDIIELLPRKR